MAVRDDKDTNPARTWTIRLAALALALVLGLYVRAQILGSELRIVEAPQRIQLADDLDIPEPEEIELPEEPEPEETVEMEPVETDADLSDEPVPSVSDMLGLDAAGAAGGDAFGLVARRGGRDLLETGDGGGCEWYATVLGEELNRLLLPLLSDNDELRQKTWSVVVELWLAPDGGVDRFKAASTGDAALDEEIYLALNRFDRVSTPPPPDLPQPVRLRVRCQS